MQTVSIAMLPQICPHHPDTRVVETRTDKSGLGGRRDPHPLHVRGRRKVQATLGLAVPVRHGESLPVRARAM